MRLVCDKCEKVFDESSTKKVLLTLMVTAHPMEKPGAASSPVQLAFCSAQCLGLAELTKEALSAFRKISGG